MRSLLELAEELGLEPGQSHTETSGDRVVRISVEKAGEESSEYADMVMLDGILNYPPSPTEVSVLATRGEWPPMDPVVVEEWDQEPE